MELENRATNYPDRRQALVQDIIAEMRSGMRELWCITAERAVRLGMSMAHMHLLRQLQAHGDMTMGRIADLLDASLSSASGLIDRMEERGLVERVRVPDDRRVVLVRLTQRGIEAIEEIEVLKDELLERVLRHLDVEQLERVNVVVRDIRSALVSEAPTAVG